MDASKLIRNALSHLVDGRIYPLKKPESIDIGAAIYIVYTPIINIPVNTNDGYEGHDRVPIQIDVYAHSYAAANEMMRRVLPIINEIEGATIDNHGPKADPYLYRQSADIRIWGTTF